MMRTLSVFNLITLDGFFEGPNQDISWHNVDEEFNEFAIAQLDTFGTILFGRITYQGMASYWPTPMAVADDPIVARKMNEISKVVFSKTLEKAEWQNTRLVKGDLAGEIRSLKQQPGKDLTIFGSGQIVSSLAQQGVIDEYRLIINPVVLGRGTPLFSGLTDRLNLKLVNSRIFRSGNVLLYYQPG